MTRRSAATLLIDNEPMKPGRIAIHFPTDSDSEIEAIVFLEGDFPIKEVFALGEMLETSGVFTPGYGPPPVGLCHPEGFIYEHQVQQTKTVLLADRNITSRFAQIAKGAIADGQLRTVAAVMSFCQCLDILIEPSVAFHELASSQGNEQANTELAWFRAADNGNPRAWIAYALGERDALPQPYQPHARSVHDFAYPLYRWRRNYAAALKIGKLELQASLTPLERIMRLLDWMERDFIVAGPAAMLACIYFAPLSPPKKGLLKQLKSPDRGRAIAGIKNAAWDITYLSDFVKRVNDTPGGETRYLLASLDTSMHLIARSLFEYGADGFHMAPMADGLGRWWPRNDALVIAQRLQELFEHAARSVNGPLRERSSTYVDDAIDQGESALRQLQ